MADVTLTYKGSTILSMDATASKTIKTGGKFCEGDIGVSYVKPSGGGEVYAAISVTYPAGSVCTATNGTITLTAADTSGQVVFGIPEPASIPEAWTINITDGTDSESATVSITEYGQVEYIEISYFAIEPFGTTSDANFVSLIQAAHRGSIDLHTDAGWAVGDTRTIRISAFTGGGNVSHAAQDIDIVISSFDDYENCGCVLQFDFKDALANGNRMNSSNTNVGGYGSSEMHTTTLPSLANALPAYFKNLLIEFNCKASAGNSGNSIKTITGNKLALRSEIEINGSVANSKAGEGSQIPYYTTFANRKKKRGHSGSYDYWWERSPYASFSDRFCYIAANGGVSYNIASGAYGVAPFGCI